MKGIRSRTVRWMGHVARIEAIKMRTYFFIEKPEGKIPLGDLGVDEKILLKWISKK
jgi:hypothetical protein